MGWEAFFLMLMEMIMESIENRGRRDVEDVLSNPTRGLAWALRLRIKKTTDLRGRALVQEVKGVMDHLGKMDREEIRGLVDMAEALAKNKTV